MNKSSKHSIGAYLIYILAVIIVITIAAAAGFDVFEVKYGPQKELTFWDCFWWALVTITTIGYGDVYPRTAFGRIIAIFLMFGGIGTLGVSTAAIAAYFIKSDQLQMLRLQRMRDHIVICGLGNKGLLLAKEFHHRGEPVVVIEQDEDNDLVASCQEYGAIVLLGNATEPEMLVRARVPQAKYLISVCGDDGANAEVAAHARELARQRDGKVLTCTTHIVSPELWYLLRKWEIGAADSFRLQFFNVFDLGARALLSAHPPWHEPPEAGCPPPHLLVVGVGRLGQNVVLHAARNWSERAEATGERLRVTLIDRDTEQVKEWLSLRHPELEKHCDVVAHSIDVQSPTFHRAQFLFNEDGQCDITIVYVCVDDDALGLSAALALLHRVKGQKIPMVVRMTKNAGLATLLHAAGSEDRGFDRLFPFSFLEQTCQPDLVLGGTNEVLARAIHAQYIDEQEKAGQTSRTNPSLVPWEQLPEETRESNRSQADHIGAKLRAVNCDIAPLTDWDAADFTFTPEEVDLMAKMEHERWLAERKRAGWTYGAKKDLEKKTNPNLVSWERSSEPTREYNRNTIRELPATLARAGFQIYRLQ